MSAPLESRGFNPVQFVKNMAKNSPWLVMAVAIHVIIGAVAAVAVMTNDAPKKEEVVTSINVAKPREEAPEEIAPPPEPIDRKAIPKNEEAEIVSFEEDVYIPTSEAQVEDLTLDRGDPNALDNLPTGGTTGGTAIGVGAGGHAGSGKPSAFGGRRLGTGAPKGRGGGATQGTEKAVLEGLRWLVRHQMPDGSWSLKAMPELCSGDKVCFDHEKASHFTENYDEGLTGMALLAFLGAGFSHESKMDIVDTAMGKRHKVGEVVKKGLQWLAKKQQADGSFSRDRPFMYNEALATLAMAEAYGLTQNRYWKEPAQKGVNFLQRAQKPNPSGKGSWGWRYASREEIEEFNRSGTGDPEYEKQLYDADTSVTAWVVMALKSAQISGLEVSKDSMDGAMEFVKWVTPEGGNGLVGYLDAKSAGAILTGVDDHFVYHPTSMSALGMCVRIFTAHDPDDPFHEQAAKRIVADLPTISKDKLSIDYYYWYYGSLALNQIDGPDSPKKTGRYWGPWNKAMVDAVVELQDTTERACTRGGWLVPDRWAHAGGPIYTTAINILTLEVYYRYENAFGGFKRN